MNLYLIRHGESEGNRQERLQGCKEYELTEKGYHQAAKLASYLKEVSFDHIYSSDLSRAFETANAVAEQQKTEPIPLEWCREINLGPLEGKNRTEISEAFPELQSKDLLLSGLDGAETIEEITKRCQLLLDMLTSKHEGEIVAVVAHGGFLSMLLMYMLHGEEWHAYPRPFRFTNTGVTHVELRNESYIFNYVNRDTHLNV
ncbi:histidine phosphatase family protein [Salsuginibacillus kocurii]|uniref:histidine phosphatase family protein n=1 Tax=Salsuginibacillus kocurii TaxID=427078 RepID=UPI00036E49DB|nr:histidine phosphatase family protein [Salsuginibacillus kocurii]